MKNQVVELENRINQGLGNCQAIIKNLERQFAYLEKIKPIESIPRTTNTKPRHEPPSIRNENNKGNDSTMHIPYTNAKTFTDVVLPNHVGDKGLKSVDGVGIRILTKKKIKKDNKGMPKEPNKE
ncbi:hypothetical protein Tco_0647155 [Tanacetum coccineum]